MSQLNQGDHQMFLHVTHRVYAEAETTAQADELADAVKAQVSLFCV